MATSGQAFQSAVLNSTNYYRAQHQAKALTWNSDLASFAANYSSGCIWRHSGGPYGENLAEGYPNVATAIDAWANEEEHYNYEKPKFSEKTGHFTQLVWQSTTSVGCGFVKCDNSGTNGAKGMYLVCEYEPRGNVKGQYRTEVQKPGESSDGEPRLGAAPGLNLGRARMLGALAAACVVFASLL
ncbi:PR-1-like protein [Teratosphaeria nubilosa]|uniref:PR-1-like protein n=1 Tax=Teratosphaeria nubilosa TaxID=161662 RepID=A0A6G1L0T4_9PEZI|nr:PR-1-like protein [Teratosphaeria nubilosa]